MTAQSPPRTHATTPAQVPDAGARAAPPLLARPWPWVLMLGLVFAVPAVKLYRDAGRVEGAVPRVLWPLPAWQFVGQDGRPFGAQQLAGRVYIADFVFTQCVTACPLLTQRMAIVQGRLRDLGDRVHLVSFSIDPRHDTPERLRAFAQRWRADAARWTFVTGPDEATVLGLVNNGFRVGVELPPPRSDGTYDPLAVAHANKFVLVDARGRVRGAYDTDPEGLDALVRDARALLAAGGS